MPNASKPPSPVALRLVTLAFPPLGLVWLWRSPGKLGRKLLGTLGIGLFSVLYAGLVIFLLVRFTSLKVEWRGGYIPALTWHITAPDYEAVERHRAAQQPAAPRPTTVSAATAPWKGFRGNTADAHYDEAAILTTWPAGGLPLAWRQPCGGGYSSFCVAESLAFTLEQRRDREVAVAYDIRTGREVWAHGWQALFSETMGGDGPRTTPAYAGGQVYVLGAEGALWCLTADTGKPVWSRNILIENHASVPRYGVAASPLIIEDKLIVLTGGGHGHSVICYSRLDGKPLWNALDDQTGYVTPMFVTLAGQPQLLVCTATRAVGLRIEDGQVLWEYPWQVRNGELPIAQPVVLASNRFLLSAGYFTGCAAVEVARTGTNFTARTLWQNKNLKNKFTSSVFWQGHIYGLDEDILTCLDAATGARSWKDGRYGYGQLLLASGCLVILSGEGELALVKADPDHYTELARFPAIHGKTWNHPAMADGKLLVRNAAEMACFDLSPAR